MRRISRRCQEAVRAFTCARQKNCHVAVMVCASEHGCVGEVIEVVPAALVLRRFVEIQLVLADAAGISQAELSRRLGWSEANIGHILAGRQAVNASGLDALARYKGVATSALLRELVLLALTIETGGDITVSLPNGSVVRLDVALALLRSERKPGSRPRTKRDSQH